MLDNLAHTPQVVNQMTPGHSNLYVTNLPLDFDQSVVESMFKVHGSVVGSKFVRIGPTPYAFIKLGTPEHAAAALKALNGTFMNGRQLLVKFADKDISPETPVVQPHDNLYVKQVPLSWAEQDVRGYFSKYGTVTSVRVLVPLPSASSQGAMVRFGTVEDAARAKDAAHMHVPEGASMPLLVRYADTPDDKARKAFKSMSMPRGGMTGQRYAPYPGAGGPPGMYGDMGPGHMGHGGGPMGMGMQEAWQGPGYGGGPGRGPPGNMRPYGEPAYGPGGQSGVP